MTDYDIHVRTRYTGPDNYNGSRITVYYNNRQTTVPFDYAARNAHVSAVCEALGVSEDSVSFVRNNTVGNTYTVTV